MWFAAGGECEAGGDEERGDGEYEGGDRKAEEERVAVLDGLGVRVGQGREGGVSGVGVWCGCGGDVVVVDR